MTIRKYIPDFITSMNIVCGLAGLAFAIRGRIDIAFAMMIAAAVFDFLDGFAARALDAYSDMGKELDSLCDLVSFGVLPSVMLYRTYGFFMQGDSPLCWITLLIAVFSALRLAKFNVDERQKCGFIGLPTPACAILCASLCQYVLTHPSGFVAVWTRGPVFIPVLSAVLSFLLVCGLPMFSMKISKDAPRALTLKRWSFAGESVVIAVLCLLLGGGWSLGLLLIFLLYIIKNIVYAAFRI